jgi:mannosyltransferase OCH1-like enzyme
LAVFNNGREEKGLDARKGMPQVIPKKIHQTWIKGEMANFKKFLIKRLKDAHPDYEYFLWTEQNITRENFP